MRESRWGIFALPAVFLVTAASAAPVPKKAGEEVFLVQEASVPKLMSMDGKIVDEGRKGSTCARLSADGKMLVSSEMDVSKPSAKGEAVIRDRAGEELRRFPMAFGESGMTCNFQWSADARRIYCGTGSLKQFSHRMYDLNSKDFTDVSVPDGFYVCGWSPDGKKLFAGGGGRVAFLSPGGDGEPEYLTEKRDGVGHGQLSPDGTKVLYLSKVETKYKWADYQLFVFDLKAKTRTRVTKADDGVPHSYCWSPDGRRLAYTWRQAFENPDPVTECDTKLITSNPDGTEPKTIVTRPYKGNRAAGVIHFMLCDWR